MPLPTATIPKGSLVLVTGATGFLGSHVVKQLLDRGYRVRGTVRSFPAAQWLIASDPFQPYAASGQLTLVQVPDLGADHAFDEAVRGVSAIAHIASTVDLSPDPNHVIAPVVAATLGILEAALREPSVREVVYTSSIMAATNTAHGIDTVIGLDTYNEDAIRAAWAPPPYEPERGFPVYMASKAEAEKAVWKFVEEKKPHFTVNTVLPAMIAGEPLDSKHALGNAVYLRHVYDGNVAFLSAVSASFTINVSDVALLHVAAILDPDTKSSRLQAWGYPTTWNDWLPILRRLRPDHKFMPDMPDVPYLTISTDESESLALLKKWDVGREEGWTSLEQTIKDNLKGGYYESLP
ncbi:putative aldehyde reductase 2 [Podospora didyma]|uniref:Aldehyde reductase 2 n=1 Tax=Podospora didyma TaxID=330526 RepID=A0AAE0NU81_9PEZI|nr:putative aldehyde reductase 2 [Podospora didyma]